MKPKTIDSKRRTIKRCSDLSTSDLKKHYQNVFWTKVIKTKYCWNWNGQIDQKGYGQFFSGSKSDKRAHRYSYKLIVGEIPEGMVLDHLCRNTKCVNPKHLEPVTQRENILRGVGISSMNYRKKICNKGHKLSGKNLRIDSKKRRVCITCTRIRNYNWLLRKGIKPSYLIEDIYEQYK